MRTEPEISENLAFLYREGHVARRTAAADLEQNQPAGSAAACSCVVHRVEVEPSRIDRSHDPVGGGACPSIRQC